MIDHGDLPCQEFVELVSDYLAGELDPEQLRRFTWHLTVCPPCVYYLEQMRGIVQSTSMMHDTPLAPDTRAHLLAAFHTWKKTAAGPNDHLDI